jgi:IS4 transposase
LQLRAVNSEHHGNSEESQAGLAMMLPKVFENFVNGSPVTVMIRGIMEHALPAQEIDQLFTDTAERQYTRELLFSAIVDVMGEVVCRIRPSIHAGYQADPAKFGVSLRAVYDKLEHTEPGVSAALVAYAARKLAPVIGRLGGGLPPLLKGYRVRILDGNHLAGTEHRLKELRTLAAGALPGHTLAVLDAATGLVTEVLCCEDGHAQERAVLPGIIPLVAARDVWVADRNFCTTEFWLALASRRAFGVIRHHGNLSWEPVSRRRYVGRSDTGRVYEQRVRLDGEAGEALELRRITIELDKPTRDGDTEIHILTNLPGRVRAKVVARLYQKRWTIEGAFQELTVALKCEVNTLAYPKAALFGFCVALLAFNVLAVVKAALRAAHGVAPIEETLSTFYLADEIAGTYRGMMIALPEKHWNVFATMTPARMARVLKELAGEVNLAKLRKHPRGPKKPKTPRQRSRGVTHVATARILAKRKATSK